MIMVFPPIRLSARALRLLHATPLLFALSLLSASAYAQVFGVRPYDCGNEGQQTCRVGQFERYNMQYWNEARCEADLKAVDGVCVNDQRRLLGRTAGWTGWAMNQQRYAISLDEPINKIPWLSSHNAYSAVVQGFNSPLYTNQFWSITDQLNWGVRHLELDPHYYGFVPLFFGRDMANRLCHAKNTLLCAVPGYGQRLFGFALKELDTWLAANPTEVVVVKLNDINAVGSFMRQEIDSILGPRIYRPPSSFTRWPTVREIRAARKQILFMQHDQSAGANPVTWNAVGKVLSNNWPIKQDFEGCRDSAGASPANQASDFWWDIAEGRTFLNINVDQDGFPEINAFTGFLWESEVKKATDCGVAIIGLDFVNALGSERNIAPRFFPFDDRHSAHIWNWEPGDFGGNASFNPVTRRWQSRPANELKRLVCAPVRQPGTVNQQRQWRLTSQSYPWSRVGGDNACAQEFNLPGGTEYVFAFPTSGYQNRTLGEHLDLQGVTESVWLGYTTGPQDYLTVQPGGLTMTMVTGGTPPPSQVLELTAPRGAGYKASSDIPWLRFEREGAFVPSDGSTVSITVSVLPEASQLPAGTYAATIQVNVGATPTSPAASRAVDLKLIVQSRTTTTLLSTNSPLPLGSAAEFEARINASPARNITGDVQLVQLTGSDLVASTTTRNADNITEFRIEGLPVGEHRFVASYLGADDLQPSDSNEVIVTVVPRIQVSALNAAFTMPRNGPAPAPQTLTASNFSPGLSITPTASCLWLSAAVTAQGQVTLSPTAEILPLPAGDYACSFTLSDNQSQTLGSTPITATLRVKTTLVANPTSLQPFLVGDLPATQGIVISAPDGDNIAFDATSNCEDVALSLANPVAPVNTFVVVRSIGRAPGSYPCQLTVDSPYALAPLLLPVTVNAIRPTVIDTDPPGRSYFVDGLSYQGRRTFNWAPGTSHTISTTFTQPVDDNTRFRFLNWSIGSFQTQTVIASAEGAEITLRMTPEYRLQTVAQPANGGSIGVNPFSGEGFYGQGTVVNLTAQPAGGFQFANWNGVDSSTISNPALATITMNAPRVVTANFAEESLVPITISSNAPNTLATIAGQPYTLPITIPLPAGRTVRIAAPGFVEEGPGANWVYTQWEGSFGSNVLDYLVPAQPASLNVRFRRQVLYSFTANPANGGTVTNNGWQLAQGELPIQAIPNEGYRFVRWTGDLAGMPNPVTLPVDQPRTATAEFAPLTAPVLYATSAGQRVDGPQPGTRRVPLQLRNRGTGAATTARITGISGIAVRAGSGLVNLLTPLPLTLGSIAPSASAATELLFNWPATATRVQFTVSFDAGDGTGAGSTTLTLVR